MMRPGPSRTRPDRRSLRWAVLLAGTGLLLPAAAVAAPATAAPPDRLLQPHERLSLPVRDVRPERSLTLDEALARTASPDGPILPGHENADGIGPGSALLLDESMLCTAAYLLEAGGTYYLSTAGHCLMKDAEQRGAFAGPHANVVDTVEICISGCRFNWAAGIDDFVGLRGTYVKLTAAGGYHPVAFAHAQDAAGEQFGYDFGLIRIPDEARPLLRPWLPQWGGPTAIEPAGVGFGDTAVHFGHGTYCCPATGGFLTRTELDQGRVAAFDEVLSSDITFSALTGWATGGDSGSAVGLASVDRLSTKGVPGDTAVGVLTHGLITGGGFLGTLLTQGIALAAGHVPGLDLVTEDASTVPQNTAPDAVDDTAATSAGSAVTIAVLANDVDADGDALQLTQVGAASNGTAVANADSTVTYTPTDGFSGVDAFSYTVSDGKGGTDSATVSVQVSGNRAPDAVDDSATTKRNQPTRIAVLANDTDADGDALTVTGLTQPSSGSATLNRDGTVTYKGQNGYTGEDAFQYTVSDGQGGTDTATVRVTVDRPGGGNRPVGF